MIDARFLDWAITLLGEIERSPEKLAWCRRYSVYSTQPGQEPLQCELDAFVDRTYREGLVITNYGEVIRRWGLDERKIAAADAVWLERQPYLCVLAGIAWHFRRDHFSEGSLISSSIAQGALLRLFRRLRLLCPTDAPAIPLQSLYRCGCSMIPEEQGVYWVLVPEGMPIQFQEEQYNPAAALYAREELIEKYKSCVEKEILYIGKAAGKKGLRQRLKQYLNFGWNNGTNHKGGRAIWQVEGAGLLLLAYEVCKNAEAREHQLLAAYKARNKNYPLANWRG